MSLVGPRPLVAGDVAAATGPVEPVERYEEWQRRRLEVRPGITGLWQVSGRNTLPLAGWVRCDLEYLDRRSLGLDLAILLRTLPVVLSGRGAY
jgi:lipopolysaccharide/colanic/teichoic acid biosynthesis glycosyltransferase